MNTLPLRRCVQLGVIALFCALPWLTAHDILFAQGTLFSFHIGGLSFADPVAALQAWPPQGELLAGAALSLLLAFFLGRIFCGWICPYGFFSELAYALHQTASGSVPAISPGRFARSRFAERLSRLLVLLLALLCTLAAGFPLLHIISMPGNISLSPLLVRIGAGFSGMIAALALPLPVVAVEALIGKRLWCRYVCPQSLLLGAAALPASKLHVGFRVEWRKEACTCRNGSPCGAACSMGLHPRAPGGPSRLDCTMCGDCIRICSSRGGALRWKWGRSAHR